jgi:hypothetical protein
MTHNNFFKSGLTALVFSGAIAFAPGSSATLVPYSQDFEEMTPNQGYPPNDLEADGWRIYGIAYDANPYTGPANIVYQYGPFDAANGDPGSIQGVATGEGGEAQGEVVLNKYTDYLNPDQSQYYIATSTFQTQIISASNAGLWRFTYDAKIGNLEADSSASAFIQTLDRFTGAGKAFLSNDTTHLPVEWGRYTLDILIDDTLIGDTLQFGFIATATNYNGSAVFYDNLSFERVEVIPVPAAVWLFGSGLLGLVGVARRRKR